MKKAEILKKLTNNTLINYKRIGKKYLLVNPWGNYVLLTPGEFKYIQDNKYVDDDKLHVYLSSRNFLRRCLNLDNVVAEYRKKKKYLFHGPKYHSLIVTRQKDKNHSTEKNNLWQTDREKTKMTQKAAKKILDIVLRSTIKEIEIEINGSEPLLNWSLVKYVIEETKKQSKKKDKDLTIRLKTSGNLLKSQILNFLLRNQVTIVIPFNGLKEALNKSGDSSPDSNHKTVVNLINKLKDKYPELKYENQKAVIEVELKITKDLLGKSKEIIDEYIKLGLEDISLRYLDPFGYEKDEWQKIGYSLKQFLNFYKASLDYLVELNQKKHNLKENFSTVFLTKILAKTDPNHSEWRSPCGAGVGRMSYDTNGDVYTCSEGMLLNNQGDGTFKLGNALKDSYEDLVNSPLTKTICTASCTESLPGCERCIYQPFCGVCPVFNYYYEGNIISRGKNERCEFAIGVLDYLFSKLENQEIKNIFTDWVCN